MGVVGDAPLVPMVLAELVGLGDVLVNEAMALNEPVVAEDVVLTAEGVGSGPPLHLKLVHLLVHLLRLHRHQYLLHLPFDRAVVELHFRMRVVSALDDAPSPPRPQRGCWG